MEINDILNRVELGEDSITQFKESITSNSSLAEQMIVSNSNVSDIDDKSLSSYYLKEYSEDIDTQDIKKDKVID